MRAGQGQSSTSEGDSVDEVTRSTSNVVRPGERIGSVRPITPLTRAEEHALRRSAPLTPTQFKTLRRMAEQGISPLRHI
jgi:predicted nuclease with RNAse H fold